ncbi:GNAT family N-acetyltransferase [Halorubrum salsamenti]|uniref:GNAT family N-acetyltransferase n=1 Tax=Halorubrum salsamenti TaxID=2583990 RepID=UPI00119FBE78|nr:GNAT family N-acetyltransferase [Halorubrum salsamenti]
MGVDHPTSATTTTAAEDPLRHVVVREAAGERDAFYLAHLWSRWFGTEYKHGHRYASGKLPYPLFPVAGWSTETIEMENLAVHGVVAGHDPPDRDGAVQIGGGFASIMSHEHTVDEPPDGGFDAAALAGERNAWLWFGVVDESWRGLGLGRRLFERRLQWARDQGADMAFAFGWEHEGRTSRPLFEAFGFIPVERFERLYEGDRNVCPECGALPSNDRTCTCAGVVWATDL